MKLSEETKQRIIAAFKRALWTAGEVALPMLGLKAGISEVDWVHVIDVCALAFVISLVKSLIVGMPETDTETAYIDMEGNENVKSLPTIGTLKVDDSDPNNVKFRIADVDIPDDLSYTTVVLNVEKADLK